MKDREYRPISEFTHDRCPLEKVLEAHKKWRETAQTEGQKADLRSANLSDADLRWTDLSEADLSGADLGSANLRGANLHEADLSEADLSSANLREADLSSANLSRANLSDADLRSASLFLVNLTGANLHGANLRGADLGSANLRDANLALANLCEANLKSANLTRAKLHKAELRGAVVNRYTNSRGAKGIVKGVNGILVPDSLLWGDSAALMRMIPRGDSMRGHSTQAVVESLKCAQKFHVQSMGLVGIVLLIVVLGLKEGFKFPSTDIQITPGQFRLLAMPLSIGLLSLASFFLRDALNGARYINDRESAMTVGRFPWAISKYSGDNRLDKLQSLFSRFVMCFHPLAFTFYYWGKWGEVTSDKLFCLCLIPLLVLSIGIFWLSQNFQKPILFDSQTELERKTDSEKLTEKISELIEIFKANRTVESPNGMSAKDISPSEHESKNQKPTSG